MGKTGHRHTKWQTVRNRKHLTKAEIDCFSAGRHAFRMRIYPDGNIYRLGWQRAAWLRGYRKAERDFNEEVRQSRIIEQTLAMEAA